VKFWLISNCNQLTIDARYAHAMNAPCLMSQILFFLHMPEVYRTDQFNYLLSKKLMRLPGSYL